MFTATKKSVSMDAESFIEWSVKVINSCKHREQVSVVKPFLLDRVEYLSFKPEDSDKARYVIDYFSEAKAKELSPPLLKEEAK